MAKISPIPSKFAPVRFDRCNTRTILSQMPRTICRRNVPDVRYRVLKLRFAVRNMSVSDWSFGEMAEKPTWAELRIAQAKRAAHGAIRYCCTGFAP